MAAITADEFEAQAAENLGMTIAELRASGQVVVPCDCDYIGCEGWQSTSRELALEREGVLKRPSLGEVIAAGSAAIRVSMDFERSMRQIQSAAGAPPEQVAKLAAQVEALPRS